MGTPAIRSVLRMIHDQALEPEASLRLAWAPERRPVEAPRGLAEVRSLDVSIRRAN